MADLIYRPYVRDMKLPYSFCPRHSSLMDAENYLIPRGYHPTEMRADDRVRTQVNCRGKYCRNIWRVDPKGLEWCWMFIKEEKPPRICQCNNCRGLARPNFVLVRAFPS